ncbi:MAG: dTDP-4-dehydrorhamnose 3,5-epimerase, partial [Deltaproteobacteria bacterium]|nr:dTDP-4-dehydrorhamnose 3,5-epimerase [Deltaproteobacteria bacterium]
MPFRFKRLEIPGLILIETRVFDDDRGFFLESYKSSDFHASGIMDKFVQDNFSHSTRDTLRGLHYQNHPWAQAKIIRAIRGEIFDVAVDIRKGSPTYGRWVSVILSDKNHRMLYVPMGFAHGFYVVSDEADIDYKTSAEYSPEAEGGILWSDPELNIIWPTRSPTVSPKDALLPLLRETDHNFVC